MHRLIKANLPDKVASKASETPATVNKIIKRILLLLGLVPIVTYRYSACVACEAVWILMQVRLGKMMDYIALRLSADRKGRLIGCLSCISIMP